MFPSTVYRIWWFETRDLDQQSLEMVDLEVSLERWLEDATLFPSSPAESTGDCSFRDDPLAAAKEDPGAALADFDWLESKVDLSILDDPKNFAIQDSWMLEDATSLLLDLLDGSTCLTPPAEQPSSPYYSGMDSPNSFIAQSPNNTTIDIGYRTFPLGGQSFGLVPDEEPAPGLDVFGAVSSPSSIGSNIADDVISICSSPNTDFDGIEFCLGSPTCDVVTGFVKEEPSVTGLVCDINNDRPSSPVASCVTDDAASTCSSPSSVVSVTPVDDPDYDPAENILSFEDIARSVKKRKFASDGKITKVILKDECKVAVKNEHHPYSRPAAPRKINDRKKLQNKEAAARYRIKKRLESKHIGKEVSELEAEQERLQAKHDDLAKEVGYLKKLVLEFYERKGALQK